MKCAEWIFLLSSGTSEYTTCFYSKVDDVQWADNAASTWVWWSRTRAQFMPTWTLPSTQWLKWIKARWWWRQHTHCKSNNSRSVFPPASKTGLSFQNLFKAQGFGSDQAWYYYTMMFYCFFKYFFTALWPAVHLSCLQVIQNYRKPLILVTPKTLLRLPEATSGLTDMGPQTTFTPVIGKLLHMYKLSSYPGLFSLYILKCSILGYAC